MKVGDEFRPYQHFNEILVVPELLCRYRGLGPGAKLTWGRLARYQGETGTAFPSIPVLAAELGLGTTQVRTYLRDLVAQRFIRVEQRSGSSSVYEFLWHEAFEGACGAHRKVPPLRKTGVVRKTGGLPLRKTEGHPSGLPETKRVTEESQFKESQSCSSKWFAEFWLLYPRKVGKGAAEKAFAQMLKNGVDWDVVRHALELQLSGLKAKEPRFVPHPATWLNQRRWLDEPEQPTQAFQRAGPAMDRHVVHAERVDATFRTLISQRCNGG